MDIKVDVSVFTSSDDLVHLDSAYEYPLLGVTMTEFTETLTQFVDGWLGPGDHGKLIHDLIKFADSDKDNRVSAY